MQVVLISGGPSNNKSDSFTFFKPFCSDPQDLHIYGNLDEAKSFLENIVIANQKHIDFILMDRQVGSTTSTDLKNWIKNSNFTYSQRNFQFKSLPVLLINDGKIDTGSIDEGFDSIIFDFPTDHLKFAKSVKSVIKNWRQALATDLDLIGLDPRTLELNGRYRNTFISYYRLKILTRPFVDSKSKRLNYIWTTSNNLTLQRSNQDFLDHIKKAKFSPSKYMEKETHEFLKQNQTFIVGEEYSRAIYEPRLYKMGRHSDIPDFLNDPHMYSLRNPEVFEVKRYTQKFIRNDTRLISRAKMSFEQVKRYKDYLTSCDPKHQFYVQKYLGHLFSNYEYTLFMGSKGEKEDYLDLIDKFKSDFNFDDIKLTTYEELLEKHVNLCDRLQDYSIN